MELLSKQSLSPSPIHKQISIPSPIPLDSFLEITPTETVSPNLSPEARRNTIRICEERKMQKRVKEILGGTIRAFHRTGTNNARQDMSNIIERYQRNPNTKNSMTLINGKDKPSAKYSSSLLSLDQPELRNTIDINKKLMEQQQQQNKISFWNIIKKKRTSKSVDCMKNVIEVQFSEYAKMYNLSKKYFLQQQKGLPRFHKYKLDRALEKKFA